MSETTHICFRDKEITDMHKILTGNGSPETGVCRQVALINERQEVMRETLDDIKQSLSGTVAIEKEIEIQRRVIEETDKLKNLKFTKKTVIAGLILYAIMIGVSIVISLSK